MGEMHCILVSVAFALTRSMKRTFTVHFDCCRRYRWRFRIGDKLDSGDISLSTNVTLLYWAPTVVRKPAVLKRDGKKKMLNVLLLCSQPCKARECCLATKQKPLFRAVNVAVAVIRMMAR